jgi:hypothetical protein
MHWRAGAGLGLGETSFRELPRKSWLSQTNARLMGFSLNVHKFRGGVSRIREYGRVLPTPN